MYVNPVSLGNNGISNPYLVDMLKPQRQSNGIEDVINIINPSTTESDNTKPWWAPQQANTVFDALFTFASVQSQNTPKEEKILDPGYINIYLQYPSNQLQDLADKITYGLRNDDDKATAIIRWVLGNFPYEFDEVNYGYEELWVPPMLALQKGSGDCEDGAFLVHSLLLHAGIDYERIRTYGGFVDAGEGAASGGHAWTSYKRKSDNEWVILDTSYYPNTKHVKERTPMKYRSIYVDNFFYFNKLYWVNTVDIDRIHNPDAYTSYNSNGILDQKLKVAGWLINHTV